MKKTPLPRGVGRGARPPYAACFSTTRGAGDAGLPIAMVQGFLRLRHLAFQINVQQPVFVRGSSHDDIVGEAETALERAVAGAMP